MEAYEDALTATSAKHAPWYIIPADHKWWRDGWSSEILADCNSKAESAISENRRRSRRAAIEEGEEKMLTET